MDFAILSEIGLIWDYLFMRSIILKMIRRNESLFATSINSMDQIKVDLRLMKASEPTISWVNARNLPLTYGILIN